MTIMKNLNKIASAFSMAALALLMLTGCEGADLYSLDAPNWISEKADSIAAAKAAAVVTLIPTPEELGTADNTQAWWSVFTDDIKLDSAKTYNIPFTNYGGSSNWNNFVIILRDSTKAHEYAILRADNWGWGTGWAGEQLSEHCDPAFGPDTDNRDWSKWLKAMSRAQCNATIVNNGNGLADVKITMVGADGVTYTQNYLNISGIDKDNVFLSFTVDNSHVIFGKPVEIPDSDPASMELKGIPNEVLVGTTFEEAMANVTAEVTFEDGMTKTIALEDLQIEAVPDFETAGTKTFVAVYNKTYKGENCNKPLIATKLFNIVSSLSAFTETVVVPSTLTLGAEDNTSEFWGAHTENIKVEPMETKVVNFTNYTPSKDNWTNFVVVLCKADNAEYAVVRADNFGWGAGYAACTLAMEEGRDWDSWRAAMNGAKVTAYITNNGDGTANVKAVMTGNDGKTYTQEYKGIDGVDAENLYFRFTVDHCHLTFDRVVGATDNSSEFWGAHSPNVKVSANQVCMAKFTNYTPGSDNWNNFVIVLCKADNTEYAVVRADNFGWGTGYAACTPAMEEGRDWGAWKSAMNGAKVTVQINNTGNGTADVKAVMTGNDGKTYTQDYIGINGIDADDLYFRFTIDHSHLVLE